MRPFLGVDGAELATRIIWHTILLFALTLIVTRDVQLRAGTVAAAFAVLLVVTCERRHSCNSGRVGSIITTCKYFVPWRACCCLHGGLRNGG